VRRHSLVFAYAAALVPALAMALTQPVWSLVDEAHHADFIVQLSHGIYPVANTSLIDPETLHVSQSTGVFRAFYPPGSYPVPDLSDTGMPPHGMTDLANRAWMARHIWQLSQESIQPPAFYVAMVPVWWVADGLGGTYAAIYAIRIICALIVATLAPMAVAVARILVPTRPEVAVMAAVLAVLLPGLDLNGTRISNDAPATALGGLLVLLAVRWAGAWTWRRAVVMGVILGAGLLVKVTLAGLAPALALSALWPAPGTTWRGGLARLAVSGVVGGLCLGPWLLLNVHNYGAIMPGPSLRLSDSLPVPLTAPLAALNVAVFELTYWTGEPWGVLPFAAPFAVLAGLLALMAPVGVIKLLRDRSFAAAGPLAVAVVAALGMIAVSPLLAALAGFEFVAPGRYAYPALPALAAMFAIGIFAVVTKAFEQREVGALYAVAAVGILAAGAAGLHPAPQAGQGMTSDDARTIAVRASGQFEGVTINIEHVAFDPRARGTWVQVTVANSGSEEAEWTVPPFVSQGDVTAIGDYLMSTHLPGDLDPGQTVTGWLFLPLDPARLDGGELHLRFPDIAVNRYSKVGDIELSIGLTGG